MASAAGCLRKSTKKYSILSEIPIRANRSVQTLSELFGYANRDQLDHYINSPSFQTPFEQFRLASSVDWPDGFNTAGNLIKFDQVYGYMLVGEGSANRFSKIVPGNKEQLDLADTHWEPKDWAAWLIVHLYDVVCKFEGPFHPVKPTRIAGMKRILELVLHLKMRGINKPTRALLRNTQAAVADPVESDAEPDLDGYDSKEAMELACVSKGLLATYEYNPNDPMSLSTRWGRFATLYASIKR